VAVKLTVARIACAKTDLETVITELERLYKLCDEKSMCPPMVKTALSHLRRLVDDLYGTEVTVRG
jgi:S-adenosylhomocysteine hydrolase